jgi:hypothetical protein
LVFTSLYLYLLSSDPQHLSPHKPAGAVALTFGSEKNCGLIEEKFELAHGKFIMIGARDLLTGETFAATYGTIEEIVETTLLLLSYELIAEKSEQTGESSGLTGESYFGMATIAGLTFATLDETIGTPDVTDKNQDRCPTFLECGDLSALSNLGVSHCKAVTSHPHSKELSCLRSLIYLVIPSNSINLLRLVITIPSITSILHARPGLSFASLCAAR